MKFVTSLCRAAIVPTATALHAEPAGEFLVENFEKPFSENRDDAEYRGSSNRIDATLNPRFGGEIDSDDIQPDWEMFAIRSF